MARLASPTCEHAVAKWQEAIALARNTSVILTYHKHPHVVLMVADDLGFEAYGLWGNTLVDARSSHLSTPTAMPALDRLAREGTRFTHAYQAAPWCSPSRTALMTGRNPERIYAAKHSSATHVDAPFTAPTVTSMLALAGYATAHLGKWHIAGSQIKAETHMQYGLQLVLTQSKQTACVEAHLHKPNRPERTNGAKIDSIFRIALAYLEAVHLHRPAYINLWPRTPHDPVFFCKSSEPLLRRPPINETWHPGELSDAFLSARLVVAARLMGIDTRQATQIYLGAVRGLDASVSHLLDGLDALHLSNKTITVFTSDHGPAFPSWSAFSPYNMGSTGGLRGGKNSVYEGGMRVPFIIRWPGRVPAGRTAGRDEVVTGVDWLPTLRHACSLATRGATAWCDSEPLPCEDGENVLQLWRGRGRVKRVVPIFSAPLGSTRTSYELGSELGPFVMRQDGWKLILHAARDTEGTPKFPLHAHPLDVLLSSIAHGERVPEPVLLADGALVELYNLHTDPTERHNAAHEQQQRLARMRLVLGEWMRTLPWPTTSRRPPTFLLGNETGITHGTSRSHRDQSCVWTPCIPQPALENIVEHVLKAQMADRAHTQGDWLGAANKLINVGLNVNHTLPDCAYAAVQS